MTNPLLLPVVLEKVFGDFNWSFSDLRNFRLTCKIWNDMTLPQWRSTATLCLLQKDKRSTPSDGKNGLILNDFTKFLSDPANPLQLQKKPFHKYKLVGWNIDGTEFGFKASWSTFCHLIYRLTLDNCKIQDFAAKLFKYVVYDKSPNLEHLVLKSCSFYKNSAITDSDESESDSCTDSENRSDSSEDDAVVQMEDLELFKLIKGTRNPRIKTLEVVEWMPFEQTDVADFLLERPSTMAPEWPMGITVRGYEIFLQTFPNVETIKMTELFTEIIVNEPVNTTEMHSISAIANANNVLLSWNRGNRAGIPPHLKNLDVMHWNLSPDSFDYITTPLLDLRLPLTSLSISLDLNHAMQLHCLLNKLETLQFFKVFVPPFMVVDKYIPIRRALLIEELEFWGNVAEDFSFLSDMPKLRKLKMDYGCFEKWHFMEKSYFSKAIYPVDASRFIANSFADGNQLTRTQLQNLEMDYLTEFHVDLAFSKEDINRFALWMPNLRCFKSVFDNESFAAVCKEMGNLKELHVMFGSDVDDFGITGGKEGTLPNITWLKDLRRFALEAYCDQGKLTDASATEGFLKMNSLYSLQICVSPSFSEKMELETAVFLNVRVIRNYGDHKNLDYECCHRLLFKKKALISREEGTDKSLYPMLDRYHLVEAGSKM